MPIKPPNLDDRRYADIVAEARALIPQYCPEWTNFNDADPGMTLVQLFAWMTELIIYRLNRVPDKTYIHFLNFIGEERRRARPSVAPLTFTVSSGRPVEVPAFAKYSTRQREDNVALDYLTMDRLTVHDARITRVMAVKGGPVPAVREIPFNQMDNHPSALVFAGGRGAQFFDLDPQEYGPDAYTPSQFFYISHDDFRLMNIQPEEGRRVGRLRVRRQGTDGLPVSAFFEWEYPTKDGWAPIAAEPEKDEVLGMPELALVTQLPGIVPTTLQVGDLVPEPVANEKWWIRGRLEYEKWLANRMLEDLEIFWKDDRGGEERAINNWEVRARGRTLEFFLQDVPPIRGGWTIRLAMIDRAVPAGKNAYLPRYRWYYRRGELWEEIPNERIRIEGTQVIITGPLTDMATDGYNIRAERIETVFFRGFCPDLELDLTWIRPIELRMFAGDDPRRVEEMLIGEGPWSPFQLAPVLPPTIGRKWYIGSDLFENRRKAPILLEMEIGFEMNGELIEEPKDLYLIQMTYRAEDNWRVVYTEDKIYSGFTFAALDEEGSKRAARRKIRIVLDPKTQLKDLGRHEMAGVETTWLRVELLKSSLTGQDEKKVQHPIIPRIYSVALSVDKTIGQDTYEQPLPGPRMAEVDVRDQNRRLTRVITRAVGRLSEYFPYYPFVEIAEPNQALYLQFDKPLPVGSRHAVQFRCRGEAFLPQGMGMEWEILEQREHARTGWRRVRSSQQGDDGSERPSYDMARSGTLDFPLPEVPQVPPDGFWMRGRFTLPAGAELENIPALPPVTHLLLNTVDVVNLHTVRIERFSGLGVPNQTIQLLKRPVFLRSGEGERPLFTRPEKFEDIKVHIIRDDGTKEDWTPAREGNLLTAGKDDLVFIVDPVEGTLTFGNGIRGRILPAGSNNVEVEFYRVVPGAQGNVAPRQIVVAETLADTVEVMNLLPATGGRDAETIEEIVRRAPSLLTSRDRAVTRMDFEVIAREASAEVARAACPGTMGDDGEVEVIILPGRREGETVPDPFLGGGLRDHVQVYLKRRSLINVEPVVRLAGFMAIDVSISLRLRPNANVIQVREAANNWVHRFLDPYVGGLDGEGWPFGGTLYAQDFARMVSDVPEVRHIVDVQLYDMSAPDKLRAAPGWEEGQGVSEIVLVQHDPANPEAPPRDLFVVRRVRVRTEEAEE